MDTQRLLLTIALAFTLLFMYQAWQADYGPKPTTLQEGTAPVQPATAARDATVSGGVPGDVPAPPRDRAELPEASPAGEPGGRTVRVTTDLFEARIDTRGGGIVDLRLRAYPLALDNDEPFRILGNDQTLFHIAQSGLLGGESPMPDHYAPYETEQERYALAEGSDEVVVPLTWTSEGGVSVIKRYRFRRDSYAVTLEHEVVNGGDSGLAVHQYRQLQRTPPSAGAADWFMYTYTGGAIYSPQEKYQKIPFDDMRDGNLAVDFEDGWAGMLQHYFATAWVPERGETNHYYTKVVDGSRYTLGLYSTPVDIAPGQRHTFTSRLFAGPKLQDRMEEIAPGLDLTVDYGVLTFIAKPIFIVMTWIHGVLGNWGWTIIALTLLIKGVLYKLSETSYRSMAEMRKLQPRLQKLKELYGDDRQKLNEKMMEIYKTEKINPLGGCLPILVQIPVFIALYWVLLESVELRQAPWILWIADLSTKDPYYILPLIMGATMFLQQKLNPQPLDPLQAKIMMSLPIVFTIFFAFFPSGLVLYWVVNSAASIAQQWVITKRIEAKP